MYSVNTYILLPIVVLICQMKSKLSLVYCSALLCPASLTCLHELACMPTTKPTRTTMPSPRVKQEKSKQVLNSRISTGKYLSVSDAAVALECLVLKQIKNNNDNNKKTWLSLLLLPKKTPNLAIHADIPSFLYSSDVFPREKKSWTPKLLTPVAACLHSFHSCCCCSHFAHHMPALSLTRWFSSSSCPVHLQRSVGLPR